MQKLVNLQNDFEKNFVLRKLKDQSNRKALKGSVRSEKSLPFTRNYPKTITIQNLT
jgi:hypothetical protein